WPGDTHARPVSSSTAQMPRFVGLKTCLPLKRKTNLLPTARTAAAAAIRRDSERRRRQSESAEISALFGAKRGSPAARAAVRCRAGGGKRGAEGGGEEDGRRGRLDVEAEGKCSPRQQATQRGDLEEPRVGARGRSSHARLDTGELEFVPGFRETPETSP